MKKEIDEGITMINNLFSPKSFDLKKLKNSPLKIIDFIRSYGLDALITVKF